MLTHVKFGGHRAAVPRPRLRANNDDLKQDISINTANKHRATYVQTYGVAMAWFVLTVVC